MDKREIKKASVNDIPMIRELTMKVWPQTYASILHVEQVAYMLGQFYAPDQLKKQMDSGHQFIICYCDQEPAGFASWSEIEPTVFKLHKIYIIPGQQGNGIGRFMIDHITDDVRKKHGTALILNVNRYNYSAIAFYKKTGFNQIKEEDIDIGNGYFMNDYVLSLQV